MSLHVHTGKNDSIAKMPGADRCRIHLEWNAGKKLCVWKKGVHNQSCYTWLKSKVEKANKSGMTVEIVILSTPLLRNEGWKKHALNDKNGGPIKSNQGIVENYNNRQAYKIICEILRKIHTELPESKYKIRIYLMWENFAGWPSGGREWAANLISYWKGFGNILFDGIAGLQEKRSIGTGTPYFRHIEELQKLTGHNDIICYIEAWPFSKVKSTNWKWFLTGKYKKIPVQWVGFWEHKDLMYEQKNSKLKEKHFTPGREKDNAIYGLKEIYNMIMHGFNPSSIFDVTFSKEWWKSRGITIPESYNMKLHRELIEKFFMDPIIKRFINLPEFWKDRKLRKLFKAASVEYKEKIKSK